jgi:phosphoglycolate phosphatase-like HAD superfamily hydrolase
MQLEQLLLETPADLVFMDCDGVIYDTNRLKCDAFRFALEGYDRAQVEELVRYHRATGGVSRYLKLERFFREMVPVADLESAMARALARFSEFCERGYGRLSPRSEALAFAALYGGAERVHVVSGSDEAELRRLFERADLRHRFAEIHGSPVTKKAHFKRIAAETGVALDRCLFVGDGWGDYDTAVWLSVPFVFLSEMSEWDLGEHTLSQADERAALSQVASWDLLLRAARAARDRIPRADPGTPPGGWGPAAD